MEVVESLELDSQEMAMKLGQLCVDLATVVGNGEQASENERSDLWRRERIGDEVRWPVT